MWLWLQANAADVAKTTAETAVGRTWPDVAMMAISATAVVLIVWAAFGPPIRITYTKNINTDRL